MSFLAHVSPETRFWRLSEPFPLECGEVLEPVQVAYRSWGRLNEARSNVVLVCHALTGSADVDDWWEGLLGPGRALDPDTDFIVASNVLGGCYGTSGPAGPATDDLSPPGPDFPEITIRDMVRLQALLLKGLGVRRLGLVIGGSMGGMQAQEWAVLQPLPVESMTVLGAPAQHSAWAVGLAEAQRSAIKNDPAWMDGRYASHTPPKDGLAVARMIAMCSYRSAGSFRIRFHRERREDGVFQVESYLRYQGEKLGRRFDANSYITLSRAMDTHDLARGRDSLPTVLDGIDLPALVLGIRSDVLYPPEEIEALAGGLANGEIGWIDSPHGHDAFLIEQNKVNHHILRFRKGLGEADRTLGDTEEGGRRCA